MADLFPIANLRMRLADLGATEVLVKHLAPNDNGKNQIYLAGDISSLGLIPSGEITYSPGSSKKQKGKKGPIFKASVNLHWLTPDNIVPAPSSKLILYPQYSEVRLSGFVKGCKAAPAELFDFHRRGREPGRILILAALPDGRVIATVFTAESSEAAALRRIPGERYGVLRRYEVTTPSAFESSEDFLLENLRRIHRMGWVEPVYLQPDGSFRPCRGTNCGGVTLESLLGIRPNGLALPDFHGWEVKQHAVANWGRGGSSRITLMTPEPSGGAYKTKGLEYFVRAWGYADKLGRENRWNFGGVHRVGGPFHKDTHLRLMLVGYDEVSGKFQGDGELVLIDAADEIAASWSFAKLIDHWKLKHAKAVYVPSMMRSTPAKEYHYGPRVQLAEGSRFNLLLRALAYGTIFYDPGIKIEGLGTPSMVSKRRSQFRVQTSNLSYLYEGMRTVDLVPPSGG